MSDIDQEKLDFLLAAQTKKAPWTNGEVIELSSFREFHDFEEQIIDYIPSPYSARAIWQGRMPTVDQIRPPKFLGRICDVSLVFTDQPYHYLNENYSLSRPTSLEDTVRTPGTAFGFVLQANLNTTRGGNVATLDTFVAYAHTPIHKIKQAGKFVFSTSSLAGSVGIRRVVAKSVISEGVSLEQIRGASIEKALELQKIGVLFPYSGGFKTKR